MNQYEMSLLVNACTYKPGWDIVFHVDPEKRERPYIQLHVRAESDASLDSAKRDGTRTPWSSGKRYLSEFMCKQEIVGAVFGLIKDAEEHEMREWFRFRDASIFNPHLDPDVLVHIAKCKHSYNVRENAMSMEESNDKAS